MKKESKKVIKSTASAGPLIEQHAKAYQHRPFAILRELIQNASDSMVAIPLVERKLEIAILNKDLDLPDSEYHMVVRDRGMGLDNAEFEKNITVLGNSSKRGQLSTIGEFGIGFYSIHAIAKKAVIISKKLGGEQAAWEYNPRDYTFIELPPSTVNHLLTYDFENHPRNRFKRTHGSSVYINIDFTRLKELSSSSNNNTQLEIHENVKRWLTPSNLIYSIKEFVALLPAETYLADYITNNSGGLIFDSNQDEISGKSLGLNNIPWDVKGEEQEKGAMDLIRLTLPYAEELELPKDWYVKKKTAFGAEISVFMFLYPEMPREKFNFYLKRLFVEKASDLKPLWGQSVHGYINFKPGDSDFKIEIKTDRENVYRDINFFQLCDIIDDLILEFYKNLGENLFHKIRVGIQDGRNLNESTGNEINSTNKTVDQVRQDTLKKILQENSFYLTMTRVSKVMGGLLTDIPDIIKELIGEIPPMVEKSIFNVFQEAAVNKLETIRFGLEKFLDNMINNVNEKYKRNRKAQMATKERPTWDPVSTKKFFKQCSIFIPYTTCFKVTRIDGRYDIVKKNLPFGALFVLYPELLTTGLDILVDGDPEIYFEQNPEAPILITPLELNNPDNHQLVSILVSSHFYKRDIKLNFIEIKKNIFTPLEGNLRNHWNNLLFYYNQILNSNFERTRGENFLMVDVRSCEIQNVPLWIHKEGDMRYLIINSYTNLNIELVDAISELRANPDERLESLLLEICHELYHHAISSEFADSKLHELQHDLDIRLSVFSQTVHLVQEHLRLKASQSS